jgi:hypothetical protein
MRPVVDRNVVMRRIPVLRTIRLVERSGLIKLSTNVKTIQHYFTIRGIDRG